jgi:hypothetical protein
MSKRKRLLQEYEKAVEDMKIEMEKKLSYHEKNPENHPLYSDEWKKFWNRRFKELQMEGKDTNSYDFKPEWILSWSKRMQEIHEEEINEKIEKLKNKILGDFDMDKSSSESPSRDSSPLKDKKNITDMKNSWHSNQTPELMEKNSDIISKPIYDKKPKVAGASPINSDSEDSINEINDHNKPREKIKIENPLNVITVLRQLSVLENQLGLLAPKIVELLSKGLVMEKIEPKSSIKLLTPENCVMFETVKEKLKGQLLAGVVKRSLVNATMFSIRNIEKLMKLAPKFVLSTSMLNSTSISTSIPTPTTTPAPAATPTPAAIPIPAATPIIVPGVGVLDKMAIAQHITQALLAQGKVDVTQEELETLINAVVGMAQSGDNIQGAKNLLSNINNREVLKTACNEINKKEEVEKKNLDQLSQGDIINLLKNFRDLTTDEQDGLITYLKDLWEKNPDDVRKFRKYIDMGPSNLKEVTSLFREDEDDDNYELSDVCKAVKEKVSEQKDEELNKSFNFEITEEQKKLLNSLHNFLPEIKSDYSLQPTNTQIEPLSDQSFYKNPKELFTASYSLDPYSAQKTDPDIYSSKPSTSATFSPSQEQSDKYDISPEQSNKYITKEHSNKYNTVQDQVDKYNMPQEQPNKYNTPQEQTSIYNSSEEQPNDFNNSQEKPDPYSVNQDNAYNDPYSQNHGNNYYQRQQSDSYYKYQKNATVSSYPSSRGYYKGNNTYRGNNTYPDTFQGTPKENNKNNRFGNSQNNRFQNRH